MSTISDPQIDRLVDGELTRAEYEALLISLDTTTDGWKRCALAFLEAQAWRSELASPPHRSVPVLAAPQRTVTSVPVTRIRPHTGWVIAASLLLGWFAGLASLALAERLNGSASLGQPLVEGRNAFPASSEVPHATSREPQTSPATLTGENLALLVRHEDGVSEVLSVPLVPLNEKSVDRLLEPPDPIPPGLQRSLRRAGFQVEQQRQLAPMRLEDGRHVIMPVDQVEIVPVSHRAYQ